MKKQFKILGALTSLFVSLLLVPGFTNYASAHEHDVFKVNNKYYLFTIGSANEPTLVDDKSGVYLAVSKVSGMGDMMSGTPVMGLESTLQVELGANGKTRTLSFEPSEEEVGAYTAMFIPTVQTTYTYRIFGTLEGSAVDVTFGCVDGVSEDTEDKTPATFGNLVRIHRVGAFSCPAARADVGFPEPAYTAYDLNQNNLEAQNANAEASSNADNARNMGLAGIALGAIGIAMAVNLGRKSKASATVKTETTAK